VHFNEVDECAGVDAIVTNRCWTALGLTPRPPCTMCAGANTTRATASTTLCGCCKSPAPRRQSFCGRLRRRAQRAPAAMYFPLGGGSLKGIGKPGEIVWSACLSRAARSMSTSAEARGHAAPGSDRAPLARDHATVAYRPHGSAWRNAKPDDGSTSRQPRKHCLRAFSGDRRKGARHQGSHVRELGVAVHLAAMHCQGDATAIDTADKLC